jgi:hypothetical protein
VGGAIFIALHRRQRRRHRRALRQLDLALPLLERDRLRPLANKTEYDFWTLAIIELSLFMISGSFVQPPTSFPSSWSASRASSSRSSARPS